MKYIISILLLFCLTACEKMVTINPPLDQLTATSVFSDSVTASSVAASMYSTLNTSEYSNNTSMTVLGGYSADEFTGYVLTSSIPYVNNQIPAEPGTGPWAGLYKVIYKANDLLEQLDQTKALSPAFIKQLSGEAKFMRAFSYFYLVNFYGKVPLITSTNVAQNSAAPRSDTALVYAQIINDLTSAQTLLSVNYLTGEKVRANKWAATALLARVYLYLKDYKNAEQSSAQVTGSGNYTPLNALGNVFLKNSQEAILQFWTPLGYSFGTVLNSGNITSGIPPSVIFTKNLADAIEPGDIRKTNWVGTTTYQAVTYYYCTKYKQKTTTTGSSIEYTMALRAAEQYLIHAEAVAQQNRVTEAVADLNIVRVRASLPAISASISKDSCIRAIAKENRVEMMGEWAQRWFDLKRTGQADAVLGALKPTWKSTAVLFPIPALELLKNPFLIQNDGY